MRLPPAPGRDEPARLGLLVGEREGAGRGAPRLAGHDHLVDRHPRRVLPCGSRVNRSITRLVSALQNASSTGELGAVGQHRHQRAVALLDHDVRAEHRAGRGRVAGPVDQADVVVLGPDQGVLAPRGDPRRLRLGQHGDQPRAGEVAGVLRHQLLGVRVLAHEQLVGHGVHGDVQLTEHQLELAAVHGGGVVGHHQQVGARVPGQRPLRSPLAELGTHQGFQVGGRALDPPGVRRHVEDPPPPFPQLGLEPFDLGERGAVRRGQAAQPQRREVNRSPRRPRGGRTPRACGGPWRRRTGR